MTSHHPFRPRLVRVAVVALAGALALGAPQAASAKTFKAHMKDRSGDAKNGSTDITKVRVAYNRKTGAFSVTATTKDPIDAANDDATFMVLFSDLVDGKCRKPTMIVSAVLSVPGVAVASTIKGDTPGKFRNGKSQIDGNTLSMRVKHSKLAGRTPGCTYAAFVENTDGDDGAMLDETKGDDGFA